MSSASAFIPGTPEPGACPPTVWPNRARERSPHVPRPCPRTRNRSSEHSGSAARQGCALAHPGGWPLRGISMHYLASMKRPFAQVVQLLPERDVLAAQDGCVVRRVPSSDGQGHAVNGRFNGQGYGARGRARQVVIVLGFTDGLAVAPGGDGVLSKSQATWQMLEPSPRRTSNSSAAPLGQDTYLRGELVGRPGWWLVGALRAGWWCRDAAGGAAGGAAAGGGAETTARQGSTGRRGRRRCQATCSPR